MTTILTKVSKILHEKKLSLVSAESCTGGWLAKQITDFSGSSNIFDRGFVTYSNEAKQDMLGVKFETLEQYGAVSEEVTKEMADGALKNSRADISVSISGIAGPDGGTEEKPVGTVCFGWAMTGINTKTSTELFEGNRDSVREQAVDHAFNGIIQLINEH